MKDCPNLADLTLVRIVTNSHGLSQFLIQSIIKSTIQLFIQSIVHSQINRKSYINVSVYEDGVAERIKCEASGSFYLIFTTSLLDATMQKYE